jgi:hypothetical protein
MFHENFRTTNHTTSLEEFAIGNVCCNVSLSLLNGNGHNIQGMKITEYDRLMNIKSICDILIINHINTIGGFVSLRHLAMLL